MGAGARAELCAHRLGIVSSIGIVPIQIGTVPTQIGVSRQAVQSWVMLKLETTFRCPQAPENPSQLTTVGRSPSRR